MNKEETLLRRNLKDSGYDEKQINTYLAISKTENTDNLKKLLFEQRKALLDKIHENQEQIDCLDFLIYSINRNTQNKELT